MIKDKYFDEVERTFQTTLRYLIEGQNIKNKSPKYVEKKPLRDFTLIMGCNVHVLAEKDVIVI